MKQDSFFWRSGFLALFIYFSLMGTLLYYFSFYQKSKAKEYVEKEALLVTLRTLPQTPITPIPPPKKKHSKPESPRVKPKPIPKKSTVKQKQKESKKPLPKPKKREPKPHKSKPKKHKPLSTKELFAKVKTPKKRTTHTKKPSPKRDLFKAQKRQSKGIENRYVSQVKEKLMGWTAQSDYAGERALVRIRVLPDGSFTFRLRSSSSNRAFNEGLIAYLKQMQRFGLGHHKGKRAYTIDVEFIATE